MGVNVKHQIIGQWCAEFIGVFHAMFFYDSINQVRLDAMDGAVNFPMYCPSPVSR